MGTRTSIRIGSILDSTMRDRLPGYDRVLEEYTYQYLLFGYRKAILGHYYATVLFQAAKTFGGLTCEVGLSRSKDFPYYRWYDEPNLGVAGFRARTTHILKGLDATTTKTYTGPDILMGHIMDLVSEAITAGNKLIKDAIPRVVDQYQIWQPIYEDWQKEENKAKEDEHEFRYPRLIGEQVARDIIHRSLRSGKFDSFLGPKKFRYRDKKFLNCHVYLLAKALAFEEPPEPEDMKILEIDPDQHPEKILFDPIGAISGRSEQPEAVELSPGILNRLPEWAFLRSFAALEALFDAPIVDLEKVKSQAAMPGHAPAPKPVGMSLDDLYSDSPVAGSGTLGGAAPDPHSAQAFAPPKPKMGKERCDPFETFADYIDGKHSKPEPDTFDFLGSQLGI